MFHCGPVLSQLISGRIVGHISLAISQPESASQQQVRKPVSKKDGEKGSKEGERGSEEERNERKEGRGREGEMV